MSTSSRVEPQLLRRLAGGLDITSATILQGLQLHTLPHLADASRFQRECERSVRLLLDRMLHLAGAGSGWESSDLEVLARIGTVGAERAIPMRVIDGWLHTGVNTCLRICWAEARQRDTESMLALTTWVQDNLRVARGAAAEAYCQSLAALDGRAQARRLMLERLLAGDDVGTIADLADIDLPSAFLVVVVHSAGDGLQVPPPYDELTIADGRDVVILLGMAGTGASEQAVVRQRGQVLAARLLRVSAGCAWASTRAEVPAARRQAGLVARLARATGRQASLHTAADVLLESALLRERDAADRLAAVLDPLSGREELLHTLTTFFVHDFNRTQTAEHLHLHRRTLQLRLQRIAELTGHSPLTARGSLMLNAALSARRLRDGHRS